MKYKIISLIILLGFFAGCQREPMIKLSEENQAIVESKRLALTGESHEDETKNEENLEGSTSQETSQNQPSIQWDTSQWTLVEGNPSLELMDYLPSQAYMIKDYYDGQNIATSYPMYWDDNNQIIQMEESYQNMSRLVFYNWGSIQIMKLGQVEGLNPYINHISSQAANLTSNELLLQSPLQTGATWQRSDQVESEITAIYAQGQIGENSYNNIIEVSSKFAQGDQLDYYAQGQGHIAQINSESTWIIQGIYPESRLNNPITFYLPKTENNQENLVAEQVTLKWQTNQNLASAFQELLLSLNIIDDTIQVQDLRIENDIVYMDFSPGVVAVLNNYDASEYGVIGAIVVSLGEFFNTNQVRLTVNNNGMLPQTVPYPTNGIYQVDQVANYFSQENASQTTSETSQREDSETLDLEIPYNEENNN